MITSEALVPEYGKAAGELLKEKVNSPKLLKDVVKIIFDKAIDEPRFSPWCAALCKIVNPMCPSFEEEGVRKETKKKKKIHKTDCFFFFFFFVLFFLEKIDFSTTFVEQVSSTI